MMTILFGFLLAITILVLIYMISKNYENVDTRYWSLFILFPIVIMGYWFKTQVTTEEGAMLAFSILYLDSTVLLTLVIFMLMNFLHISVRPWIRVAAYSVAFGHLGMIWLCFKNGLYYKTITLTVTESGTITKMTSGPLKVVHWIYLTIVLAVILTLLVMAFYKKGTYSRRSLWLCTVLLSSGLIIYVAETLVDIDFSLLPILYVMADIMVASNYDHAHMHDITGLISQEKEGSSLKGYAALDMDRRFLSSNVAMYQFLPELEKQIVDARLDENGKAAAILYTLIEKYEQNGETTTRFKNGKMDCECEITGFSLRRDGKSQGYLFSVRDVTEEQHTLDMLNNNNETIRKQVAEKTENIRTIQRQVVLGLANMIENRDNNTGGHVKRTSDIIGFVVEAVRRQGVYQIDNTMAQDIVRAAPMHDLGKITIENGILLKKGKLSEDEYETMKTHAVRSGEFVDIILKDVEEEHFVRVAHNVARYHHERWDGKGYPEGLVGEMIPLEARIMAIADVYDALVSARSYKPGLDSEETARIMIEGMGTQFDPNMYAVFLECRSQLEDYYREHARFSDHDRTAAVIQDGPAE